MASEAARIAVILEHPVRRASRLVQLAIQYPEDVPTELVTLALDNIRQIDEDYVQVVAFSHLAEQLPDDEAHALVTEALAVTQRIESEEVRSDAVAYLASRAPEQSMAGLLDIAGGLLYPLWSIAQLAPYLPDHLLGDALHLTEKIIDDHGRAQLLGALTRQAAPSTRPSVVAQAVAAARACADGYFRAKALAELIGRHDTVDRTALAAESLAAARTEISDYRAEALAFAATYLPRAQREAVCEEALEATRDISLPSYRAMVIGSLIPWLPPGAAQDAVENALTVARAINIDYIRITVMAVLATHVDATERGELLDETVNEALASSGLDDAPMSAVHRVARYLRFIPRHIRNDLLAKAGEVILTFGETRRLDLIYNNAPVGAAIATQANCPSARCRPFRAADLQPHVNARADRGPPVTAVRRAGNYRNAAPDQTHGPCAARHSGPTGATG